MHNRIIEKTFHLPVGEDALFVKLLLHSTPEAAETQPTWVFLHEALGSVGQWKSFPYELCRATGLDGIVYDRVGHGRSSPMRRPRDSGFYREEAELYLRGLLKELNVRRPLLFGHSDGATLALTYASAFPDEVEGVVSEAAHVVIEDITVDGIREAQALYGTTDLRDKLSRYHAEKTDAVFSAWADSWLDPALADWDMLGDLRGIRCPVLVVQGSEDQYGSRRQVDLIVEHAGGPAEILWLEGVGHVPHLQARQRIIDETTRWSAAQRG
ncbi:MAG: alpha/beta hydrolase [Bacteroidetes bacterium]|nr:alpha/beta hydrolase [Bacteroidota bacterium]